MPLIEQDLIVGVDDTGHDVKFFGATSGKYMLWDESDDSLRVTDGASFKVGLHGDLKLMHDGSNSYIFQQNAKTGNFYIDQRTDDADLIFRCDDGSGGQTAYITLDGSASTVEIAKNTNFAGDVGVGDDLNIAGDELTFTNDAASAYIRGADALIIESDHDNDDGSSKPIYFYTNGTEMARMEATVATFAGDVTVGDDIFVADLGIINVGTGNDLQLYHDGTDSWIENTVGDFYVVNNANGKDVILTCDDGSGAITPYITLDGSATTVSVHKNATFDSKVIIPQTATTIGGSNLGNASLLVGSTSTGIGIDGNEIVAKGDHLYIGAATNDKSIIFRTDATANVLTLDSSQNATFTGDISIPVAKKLYFGGGSHTYIGEDIDDRLRFFTGGTEFMRFTEDTSDTINFYTDATFAGAVQIDSTLTVGVDDTGHDVKFFGATSGRYMLWDESQDRLEFTDDVKAVFGTNADLVIYHDGSNSYITQQDSKSGNLIISQNTDDADIIFKCDDGSGGTTAYLTLDGSAGRTVANKQIRFPDSVDLAFGGSTDFQISHDGTNNLITSKTGDLIITNTAHGEQIYFKAENGSGTLATYLTINGSSEKTIFSKPIEVGVDDTGYDVKFFGATSGRYLLWDESDDALEFTDNARIKIGTGNDLNIYNDGTNSYIATNNTSGNFIITQNVDDADLVFKCDDGSGGNTAYITLDGGLGYTTVQKDIRFNDSVELLFGTDSDFKIKHDGSDAFIRNFVGDFYVLNAANDKDIIFQSDDGSGGTETYFYLDGSASSGNPITVFPDLSGLYFGDSTDLSIRHDGTDSTIQNNGGDFIISQHTNDKDLIFQCDDGSGGVTAYLTLDGSDATMRAGKKLNFADNIKATFGISDDLQIYHNGSNSFIQDSGTGDLRLLSSHLKLMDASENLVLGVQAGAVAVTGTLTVGVDDTGHDVKFYGATAGSFLLWDESDDSLNLTDSTKLKIGDSADLEIYHDGSNSYIDDTGTGNLKIRSNRLQLEKYTGETMAEFIADGGSSLYYNNAKKIETTSAGVTVTGSVTATDGNLIIGDDGQIGSASATNAMEIADDGTVSFNGGISAAGNVKSTIKTRIGAVTSSTDGDHKMGDVVYFGSTTSMTTGAIYHYKSDGTWELADADSAATCDGLLGIALGAASNTNGVLLRGFVTLDHDPGAVGDVLFVSTTAGDTTATAPSGSGDIVRVIGYCLHASSGMIYFNPDGTFVEVA